MAFKGLSEKQVLELREKFGENSLPFKEESTWLSILFSQFKSPLIYILIIVGVISFILKEYFDAGLIAVVIIVNVLMGFFQEYNAKKTLTALKNILKPKTIVIRDGKRKEIEVKELVPKDLVVLGSGDRVPADGRLVEGVNLLVNEAILTGEEEAVIKTEEEKNNLLFMGTTVVSGRGVMEVVKIGKETEMGKIGKGLAEIKEEKTLLQIKLEVFAKNLAVIVLFICLLIFFIGVLHKENPFEMFRMAVILSIAAIPEGLPIITTMILALGMRRILKKNGLVKSLLSIETLGSTSVICTDKTGTLTEGKMKVVKIDFTDEEKALLAITLDNGQKSSLEIALWEYIKNINKFDPQEFFDNSKKVYEEPFDSEKKYSMVIDELNGKDIAFLMGAPEIVISFCQIQDEEKNKIIKEIEAWADEGLRLLGVAFKEDGNLKEKKDFAWLGLVGVADPIREDVKESIIIAQKAGIKIKIVTGDYRKTAERIATNLGFKIEPKNVLEGNELEKMSEEELEKIIDDIILFTRVTPHQKYKIVKALQDRGEIVAMTGDGVNDALALKKANIGVAVGTASDVAKEAADLILLDNNFKTIVAACEEGRLIFSNIKKSVGYILSNSFAEIFLIFGAVLLDFPAPLLVVQILWIHLICDGPPDLALAFESKEKSLMKKSPKEIQKEGILSGFTKFLIFAVSFTVGILSLFFFWKLGIKEGNLYLGRTIAFAIVGSASLIYVVAFKNLEKLIIKTENFFQNKFMIFGIIYGFLLLFLAIYLPFFNKILETVPLKLFHWLIVFGVAILVTLIVEFVKILNRKSYKLK